MKAFEIGFIDGHSLKYRFETVRANNQEAAIRYLRNKWGSGFEHVITSVTEKPGVYVYYTVLRPTGIGTCPKGFDGFQNYTKRQYVSAIKREAWGWIAYASPLTERECQCYDLVPDPRNGLV